MRTLLATTVVLGTVAAASIVSRPDVPEPGQAFIAPLADQAMLLDGVVVDDRLVVVGEHGIVLISDDGGRTWSQPQTGTRATLTGVHFANATTGWAVGHDAVILRTTDGGATWEEVYADPDDQRPLFDVWFADERNGFAIGAYGLYLGTTDGGTTWEPLELIPQRWTPAIDEGTDEAATAEAESEDEGTDAATAEAETDEEGSFDFEDDEFYDFHLNHIVPGDNGELYIAAEAGRFFRSVDDGETWLAMPSIYEGSYFSTLPLGDDELLLMGLRGNLFYSADRGRSWEPVSLPVTVLLNDGLQLDDGTILIGGMAGALLESNDGGRTFTLHQQRNRKAISVLLAIDGDVVIVGEAGVVRKTLDELRAGGEA